MDSTADRVLRALQQYDIKGKGPEYRCNSPLRPGSNSHAFTLKIEGPEHGAYHDFVSGDNGSLYELAARLGIAVNAAIPVENSKRVYRGIVDYAQAHGVDVGILEVWGWRQTEYQNRPALEFPTSNGPRYRFYDGKKPAYKSIQGYKACWYGLSRLVDGLARNPHLVICNGEISTIAGQQWNLNAISVTGGEKEIPPALVAELKGQIGHITGLKISIALDCDNTGHRVAGAMLKQLQEAGFTVRAVDLGLSAGGDLADFCKLYQGEARDRFAALPDLPGAALEPDEQPAYRFLSLDQVLNLPPVSWLIPELIPNRGLAMLYGPSGVGKSFYALQMAFDLAKEKRGVVYIAAEGEGGMSSRARALVKHFQARPQSLYFVYGSLDLFEDDITTFTRLAQRYNPAMIVVDTLHMCSGDADENSSHDMRQIITSCKRITDELDSAILVVHHSNKGGREARGSGALFAACDQIMRLSAEDDMLKLECMKSKDSKQFDPQFFRSVVVHGDSSDSSDSDETSLVLLPAKQVIPEDELTPAQVKVIEMLEVEPSCTLRALADLCEQTVGTTQRALKVLNEKGYVTRSSDGYQITEAGFESLNRVNRVNQG